MKATKLSYEKDSLPLLLHNMLTSLKSPYDTCEFFFRQDQHAFLVKQNGIGVCFL